MQRPSIARRLYVRLTASLLVLWLVVVASEGWVILKETEETFDSSLQETAQRILSLTIHELQIDTSITARRQGEPRDHDEYLSYQLFDRDGALLMRSHAAPAEPYPIPLQVGFHPLDERRFYVEASKDGAYWIKVAEHAGHRGQTFWRMLETLLLPLGVLIPLSLLAIHLSVRGVRDSVRRLDRELAQRDSRELQPIDTATLPIELLQLGETVNTLMSRLQSALEAERHFAANSAHELRTPIAAAMAQLDVLRDELKQPPAAERLAKARTMLERLERTSVKLLQLARAESGERLAMQGMDLLPVANMLVRDLTFRSRRAVNVTQPGQPVRIVSDTDALGIVIQNLLENADRYGTPETPIEVVMTPQGELIVRNDCEAIPPATLFSLRERFVRGNHTQTGSGIGLSIVDTILRQCHATLRLESPCYPDQRGFAVSVQFALAD